MDLALKEWLSLGIRWVHMITAIAWIGSSFYFIWLDLSLRQREGMPAGVGGENWSVHGGGFYHVQKYLVAPEQLPEELHWFKYEAYFTWITGFLLLALLYYWGAESYLIDPDVRELAPWQAIALSLTALAVGWLLYDLICRSPIGANTSALALAVFVLIVAATYLLTQVFSARAAFLHVGAIVATIMTANVFFVIIPNQKKTVAAMIRGDEPDAIWGQQAKQRSTHNNYLTLPVLLMMISSHYPMLYAPAQSWIVIGLIVVIGGVVRDFFNSRNAGAGGWRIAWQFPVSILLFAGLVGFVGYRPNDEGASASAEPVAPAQLALIFEARCLSCHSRTPTDEDFKQPPGGVVFDRPADWARFRRKIYQQVVIGKAMPLGNKTGMTAEERLLIARWYRSGS